jgi:hypothetical protein
MAAFVFRPEDYGEIFAELWSSEHLPPLGPGIPQRHVGDQLQSLTTDRLFDGAVVRDLQMANCCLAGLWLWFDFLDESHQLSQRISSPSGSYWHGIMHRREPDYDNAKYWFRKVGQHPVHDRLAVAVAELIEPLDDLQVSDFLDDDAGWDALGFVDLCERYEESRSPAETLCRKVARVEWQLLFDECWRGATRGARVAP